MTIPQQKYFRGLSGMIQLIHKLAAFLKSKGRLRVIKDRDGVSDYLERYYLLFSESITKERGSLPNVLLHKFCRGDQDDLHDHPWNWISIILTGGYWEYTPQGSFWRSPLSIRFGKATDLHRIELDPNAGEVWTIFITGKRFREWGFLHPQKGWMQWEKYLEEKQ